jgi:SAM-dependent methyltransferase
MSALYKPFLEPVPENGRILDAGCGSGRDSLYFKRRGYQVEAFDGSAEMCRLAARLIGQPVRQKTFEEVDWVSEFDGVWACASLLHVGHKDIDSVLERLTRSLRAGGVLYVSFKKRDGDWEQSGRFFSGYSQESLFRLLAKHPVLVPISIWTTADARPSRIEEKWLNALLRKHGQPLHSP